MLTINYAAHTAHLDPMAGVGLLVLPHADADALDPFPTSTLLDGGTVALGALTLHEAAWDAVVRDLDARGWEVLGDEETGAPIHEGITSDGRTALALYGAHPTASEPDMLDLVAARADLLAACGVAE